MKSRTNLSLLVVACVASGLAAGLWLAPQSPSFTLPPLEVGATATAAHDNFVIATGFVEDDIEGLFFLDFLTGDLKATVLDRRGRGFNAAYRYNITNDFAAAGKSPKYLMVTGVARDLRGGGGNVQLARSVLYVVEANSGQVVVYGLPYNRSRQSAGKPQGGTFVPIARASLRAEVNRDQQ